MRFLKNSEILRDLHYSYIGKSKNKKPINNLLEY